MTSLFNITEIDARVADVRYLLAIHHARLGLFQLLEPKFKWHCRRVYVIYASKFWATVCKTVRNMLSDRCPVCPVCLQRWCTVAKRLDGSRCHLV